YIVHGMNGFLTPAPHTDPVLINDAKKISDRALQSISSGHNRYLKKTSDLTGFILAKPSQKYRNLISPLKENISKKKQKYLPNISTIKHSFPKVKKVNPKLTVITVVRNDVCGLLKTINSVASQTYNDFEYIIIDGQSTDRTISILKKIPNEFATWISEADDGPYDAMNKGVKIASGDYVLFLNAGDTLFCDRTLEFCMDDDHRGADIIYGHHIYKPEGKASAVHKAEWLPKTIESLKSGQLDYSWLSGIPCHQSTITRSALLRARPYDAKKYKIAADHDFLFSCLLNGATSHHTNIVVSNYYGGGMSSQNIKKCVNEWKEIAINYSGNAAGVESFYDRGKFW
ncbi:MAG: glycosyltransferase, partial [Burkholderiales bacterium]|nr:glycosyltransferase [Burkholderiales bacterium]